MENHLGNPSYFLDKLNKITEFNSDLKNKKVLKIQTKKSSEKQKQLQEAGDNWRICFPHSNNHMKKLFVKSEKIAQKYKILFGDEPESAEETLSNCDVFKSHQTFKDVKTQIELRKRDKTTDKYCREEQVTWDDKSSLNNSGVTCKHSDEKQKFLLKKQIDEDSANSLNSSNGEHLKPGPLCFKIRSMKHIWSASSRDKPTVPQATGGESRRCGVKSSGRKRHSSRQHKYSCNNCNEHFSSESLLKDHLFSHNQSIKSKSKQIYKYDCKECGKAFQYKHVLRRHEFGHQKEKPFKCNLCNAGFIRQDALKVHQIKAHTEIRLFTCNLCDSSFDYAHVLKRHRLRMHKDKKRQKK